MKSENEITELRIKKRKNYIFSLYFSCMFVLSCATVQTVFLAFHCGRDFRYKYWIDPTLEETIINSSQIFVTFAALFGIWYSMGASYFALLSILFCTLMLQHFVDLLQGILYYYLEESGQYAIEKFLSVSYEEYKIPQDFIIFKVQQVYFFLPLFFSTSHYYYLNSDVLLLIVINYWKKKMSTTKFAESNRSRKRKINIWSLGITCVLIMFCAVYQTIILTTNCGRYFRVSNLIDPRFEQLFMLSLEIALMIGGLIGLCTNRGAFYFVFFSFWICTCMIQHFVDLVMGIIYMNTYGDGEDGVKYFMEETLKSVRKGKIFSISKINRVQRCKKCCGLTGPQDPQVQLSNNTLIAACCPDSTGTQICTADNAFQAGCVEKLLKDDHKISLFHTFSGVSIIFQFYCYRGFLNTFV